MSQPGASLLDRLVLLPLLRGLNRLACDTADRAGAALGVLAWHLGVRRRACSRLVGDTIGLRGPARRRAMRRAYATFGANALAVWTIGGPDGPERRIAAMNPRWTARVRATHRSLVAVTPHLGCWDAGALGLHALVGPTVAYAKPQHAAAVDALLNARRSATGAVILITRRGDRTEALKVLRTLRDGGVAGLIADQRPHPEDAEPAFFLGRTAWCHPGAAFFAAKAKVPVVPGCCLRRRAGRYAFLLGRPRSGATTQDTMDWLSALIAAAPGQYFWMHHRFKRTPPELPPRAQEPWRSLDLLR